MFFQLLSWEVEGLTNVSIRFEELLRSAVLGGRD